MPPILEVKNLGVKPQGKTKKKPEILESYLLKGIEFSVGVGEVFGVTGHSGAGKSTLLKLLCRMADADEGHVFFEGKPLPQWDPRELRRQMILVFQVPALLGPTVLDDISLGTRIHKEKGASPSHPESWAKDLLERVHLPTSFLRKNSKDLSVGEAQRVALARALALEPQMLLLDEPTASLDLKSKQAIEASLKEMASHGLTIVLVSHDHHQIKNLAPRGIELDSGKIVRQWPSPS